MTTPTDPLYATQWHFAFLGNIEAIWAEFTGTGVTVGVYDDGIDYNHVDLNDNYNAALQVLDDLGNVINSFPAALGDGHGTAVAGLIGAEANGTGGVGVAYGVDITGVNIFGASVFGFVNGNFNNFMFVVQQADNFDISSNSWSAHPGFYYGNGLLDGGFSQVLSEEYGAHSASARDGLGTIFVQAAGNDNEDANGDGTHASRFTITVAATDATGFSAYYSQYGASILVTAPAASVTTDVTGAGGYNATGDYTNIFGGTSAATPVVSGVVALMLDANDGLGWRDVQNILAMSATLTGSALNAITANIEEEGLWNINAANNWNNGGAHIHTNYGYGMVNAYNAVRMAEVWTLFNVAQTSANEVMVTSGLNDFADTNVPDGTGVAFQTTFTIAGGVEIDHVALRLNFATTWVGDLRIVLTSAEGTVIVVQDDQNNSIDTDYSGEWQFGIDGLRGELAAGTWTMQVFDDFGGDTLTVRSATLDVYGAASTVHDVYHFTNEFLTMNAFAPSRGTTTDTDGGTDWLNFAAVSGNITLAMGSNYLVNSVLWGTLSGDFENAVTGDGHDNVTGNLLANTVHLMRGNDTFAGGSGLGLDHDTVYGGAGNDSLDGGAGNDSLYGGTFADRLTGGSGNDAIDGGAGLDTLTGGTGNDSLIGGADSDWYYVDNAADIIVEGAGGGTADRVLATVNFTLAADDDVEQLTTTALTSTYAVDLTGNGLAQFITGNAGVNRLNGGGGNDTINGSAGLDTLIGGTGNDSLIGGADSDWYYVDHAADIIVEGAGGGTADRVLATVYDTLAADDDVEQLTTTALISTYAVDLTGNGLAQFISGNAAVNRLNGAGGNDTINGGAGLDTLNGGTGNDSLIGGADSDWYYVDNAADIIVESAGGGTADRVLASVNFTLAADDDIEQLTTTALTSTYAVDLTGNGLAQFVSGNAGVNSLNGGGGNDTMTGGLGADIFVFNTTLGAGNIDRITDFSATDDTVYLDDAFFAGLIGGALAAGAFVSNLTGVAGDIFQRILHDFDSGALFFDADGSNTGAAVQFATISPNITLTAADFFVI